MTMIGFDIVEIRIVNNLSEVFNNSITKVRDNLCDHDVSSYICKKLRGNIGVLNNF